MARLVNLASYQQFAAINLTADPGYDPNNRVIPSVAKIVLSWNTAAGVRAHNVLHGRYSGAFHGSPTEANSMLVALTTGAQWTALAAHLGAATSLADLSIRDLGVIDAPEIPNSVSGGVGTSSGTDLPAEVALVISLKTAFIGPANRGRVYIPGWATTALGASGNVNAAAVTALQNWAGIIAGVLSAQGYTWGIGHYSRLAYVGTGGKQHPARPAGLVPIQTVSVNNTWDTQRRRGHP